MELNSEMGFLKEKLAACHLLLNKSCSGIAEMTWLNKFCAQFLEFANILHGYLNNQLQNDRSKEQAEIICLCLTQIVTCIGYMECTIKAESAIGAHIPASRQHFRDRMYLCLKRLYAELRATCEVPVPLPLEELTFLQLVDAALDALTPFSSYQDENVGASLTNMPENKMEYLLISGTIRRNIDSILRHTLAFANVTLEQDKKALSALCQKVIRDCRTFQLECEVSQSTNCNRSNRKLKAVTLEHAIYQLEDYINESLLRLVFKCFLDFDKFSIDKMRIILKNGTSDDTADEFIADFDVNVDRTTQIGIFAIAFAPSLKMKTTVRSCLASFESLDTSLVPALQTNGSDLHSELLEQHFNEEVAKFKIALQEIIDSRAFVDCYLEILTTGIKSTEKVFDKFQLEDLAQMASFIVEHFQLAVNQKVLLDTKTQMGCEYLKQFIKMIRECKAILICADQVEPQRIIKRFKILRTILRKLQGAIAATSAAHHEDPNASYLTCISTAVDVNEGMLESLGITPTTCSILYESMQRRPRTQRHRSIVSLNVGDENTDKPIRSDPANVFGSVRRKQSLRTAMFKRQNIAESKKLYNSISNQSASLQISDILDQLTNLSTSFNESTHKI